MREIISVKERYKEIFGTIATMFLSVVVSVFSILLLIVLLPFIWCDKVAEFFANLLDLEIFDE